MEENEFQPVIKCIEGINMKKAVMYGAGNIGRGFIGKVLSESGYEVCFIDVAQKIVEAINIDKEYPVKIVSNEYTKEVIVKNVCAVDGNDVEAVADAIMNADIMATAVGVNVLPKIVKLLCEGLRKRFAENKKPLNIIICENLIDSNVYLRKLIEEEMGEKLKKFLDENMGLVEASIGRMVPLMTDEMKEGNILKVWVEPFEELPVDQDAIKGGIPEIKGIIPFSPFGFYIKRKLFIHNLGHAVCAYLGWQKGYVYIYECCYDKDLYHVAECTMQESAHALHKEYNVPLEELYEHIKGLLFRFKNKVLGDTVARVGNDLIRKLNNNDRLTGAALYCIRQGVNPENIIKGIVAGLRFDNKEDLMAIKLNGFIKEKGIEKVVEEICGLDKRTLLFEKIVRTYRGELL